GGGGGGGGGGKGVLCETRTIAQSASAHIHHAVLPPVLMRFYGEVRNSVMIDLLFDMLQKPSENQALLELAEHFIWSSWTVHSDEGVMRLMEDADKLSTAQKLESSNAALEKVI
ncbi:unnamed protein product, partial [Choristocarpus tenellus]